MSACLEAMPQGSCVLMEIWPESWAQQDSVHIENMFDHLRHRWSITGDDMRTSVSWPDFEDRVRHIFYSGRYTGRGWDVLLRKL
jgi:hypothetical protein